MKCENCGQEDATIHLTKVAEDEMRTYHLCERCAAEQGLEGGTEAAPVPLTDFLAQMGKTEEGAEESARSCPTCGLTTADFKKSGRLGCADCYASFETELRNLFRRLHGATQHVGKVYLPPDPTAADRTARMAALRKSLQRAVQEEDFERAATLRDEIREMEHSG